MFYPLCSAVVASRVLCSARWSCHSTWWLGGTVGRLSELRQTALRSACTSPRPFSITAISRSYSATASPARTDAECIAKTSERSPSDPVDRGEGVIADKSESAKEAASRLSTLLAEVELRMGRATYIDVIDSLATAAGFAAQAAQGREITGYMLLSRHGILKRMASVLRQCNRQLPKVRPRMLHMALYALLESEAPPDASIVTLLTGDLTWLLRRMKITEVLCTVVLAKQMSQLSVASGTKDRVFDAVERSSARNETSTHPSARLEMAQELLSASVSTVERRWAELSLQRHALTVLANHHLFSEKILQRVEDVMLDMVPCLTLEESSQLLQNLAIAGRRPLPLLRAVAHHQSSRMSSSAMGRPDQGSVLLPSTVTQCLRMLDAAAKLSFSDDALFEHMADTFCLHLHDKASGASSATDKSLESFNNRMLSLLVLCGRLHWRCPRLIDPLVKRLLTGPGRQYCSATVVSRILHSLATVNYLPSCWGVVLPWLLEKLSGEEQLSCAHRVNAIWSLVALDVPVDAALLSSVLSEDFGRRLLEEAPGATMLHTRLLNLLATAVTRQDYSGPLLTAELVSRLSAPRAVSRSSAQLTGEVLSVLHHHLPADYLRPPSSNNPSSDALVRPANLYGLSVEAEFAVRQDNGEPIPWRLAPSSVLVGPADYHSSAGSKSPPGVPKLDRKICPVVLKVWSPRDFTLDTSSGRRETDLDLESEYRPRSLCGYSVIQRRLLQALGYRVLEVSFQQFTPSAPTIDNLKMLISKIKNLVNA